MIEIRKKDSKEIKNFIRCKIEKIEIQVQDMERFYVFNNKEYPIYLSHLTALRDILDKVEEFI